MILAHGEVYIKFAMLCNLLEICLFEINLFKINLFLSFYRYINIQYALNIIEIIKYYYTI